jgi:hypothetical protein
MQGNANDILSLGLTQASLPQPVDCLGREAENR